MVIHFCAVCSENTEQMSTQLQELQIKSDKLYESRSRQLADMETTLSRILIEIKNIEAGKPESVDAAEIVTLSQKLSTLSLTGQQLSRERILLNTLDYEYRPTRHDAISQAHRRTFDWVFKIPRGNNSSHANLMYWLQKLDKIFWVSGRPGSGKSTLMKYMADDPRTQNAISKWASPQKGVIASHYFWSAGTEIQKSQKGLLMSLLYGVLQEDPSLIPTVCEERWMALSAKGSLRNCGVESWTISELRKSLDILACQQGLEVKFCFFIDGLDEYAGDHPEICQDLHKLSRSPHIKICVSSRPWNAFCDSFGADTTPKLFVHDLTRDDIRKFSESRLLEHPRWSQPAISTSGHIQELVNEITERAHGVFLWVFLVTKLLRDGLTNHDSFQDLRRRLDTIPTDLGEFFKHMLNSVDTFYHEKMVHTLRIALAAKKPLECIIYGFHELEYENEDYAISQPIGLDKELFESLTYPVPRQIESRTKGLLEVKFNEVHFLHRTVRDFLATGEMATFVLSKSRPQFEPSVAIMRALIAQMKIKFRSVLVLGLFPKLEAKDILADILEYANDAEISSGANTATVGALLDDVELSLETMRYTSRFGDEFGEPFMNNENFLRQILMHFVVGYASKRLKKNPYTFHWPNMSALTLVMNPLQAEERIPIPWSLRQVQLLQSLLSSYHDPNAPIDDKSLDKSTPWISMNKICYPTIFLAEFPEHLEDGDYFCSALNTGVILLFLRFGADPNAPTGKRDVELPAWLRFFFMAFRIHVPFKFHDSYLGTLRRLLMGADFKTTMKSISTLYPPWERQQPSHISAWDLLRNQFELLGTPNIQKSLPAQQLSFLSRVLILFIEMSQSAELLWLDMQGPLQKAFPVNLLKPMLDAIQSPLAQSRMASSVAESSEKRKRCKDEDENRHLVSTSLKNPRMS
ncbi:hypothetical protein F5884DRAFT_379423 [Xylogone sp. PMI_703]|nr:hypothetical protein F5884DRAFT_379423 [Xylogone sp. PMI_703]